MATLFSISMIAFHRPVWSLLFPVFVYLCTCHISWFPFDFVLFMRILEYSWISHMSSHGGGVLCPRWNLLGPYMSCAPCPPKPKSRHTKSLKGVCPSQYPMVERCWEWSTRHVWKWSPYDFCFDALLFLVLNLSIMESDSFVHPRWYWIDFHCQFCLPETVRTPQKACNMIQMIEAWLSKSMFVQVFIWSLLSCMCECLCLFLSKEGIAKVAGGSTNVTHANAWEGQGSANVQSKCLTYWMLNCPTAQFQNKGYMNIYRYIYIYKYIRYT